MSGREWVLVTSGDNRASRAAPAAVRALAADGLAYPLVIKPDIKTRLALRVDSAAALRSADLADGPLITQPFLNEKLRGIVGVMWEGRLVSAAHMSYRRIWPTPCGTITAGETRPEDVALEEGLGRML